MIILLFSLLMSAAHANSRFHDAGPSTQTGSGSTGNGGEGMSCLRPDGKWGPLKTYDLVEGELMYGYHPRGRGTGSALNLALNIAAQIQASRGAATTMVERVRHVAAEIASAPDNPNIPLTSDIKPGYLPDNCKLTQVIIFYTPDYMIANQNLFKSLSASSKAALYLHEAIYWYLRESEGETNSRRTRQIVAYLMSGGNPALAFNTP